MNELHSQPPQDELDSDTEGGVKLPVDPRALILAFWKLRLWILIGLVAGGIIAVIAAETMASRTWTAQTIMLYQPPLPDSPEAATMPSLNTLLNMVKLPSNLEEVNSRLEMDADLRTLGSAIDVSLQQKTTLVVIKTKWDSPSVAPQISNTLREVFLENQTRIRRDDAQTRVNDLELRLNMVTTELKKSENALRDFTKENRIVELTEEARALLEEMVNINLLYEQAQTDKRSIELQAANTEKLISDLKTTLAEEQEAQAALSDAMSETNIRIQRLRESIADDVDQRVNTAKLEEAFLAWERAKNNFEVGVISKSELEAVEADYRTIEAQAVDTQQVEQWKKEIEELDNRVIPSQSSGGGVTGNLLRDIMLKSFEIKLQEVTVAEKVASYAAARERIEVRLQRLPDLQRTFAELTRDVETFDAEKKVLEERLGEARRILGASALPFALVSEAERPPRPSSSNAKKIAIGVAVLFWGVLFAGCALIVAADLRIRTLKELETMAGGAPVLGELPSTPHLQSLGELASADEATQEHYRVIVRRLRAQLSGNKKKLLITAPGHGEGTSTTTLNVAMTLGRWGERVLIVDANVRSVSSSSDSVEKNYLKRTFDRLMAKTPKDPESKTLSSLDTSESAGLSKALQGDWEKYVVSLGVDNVDILPTVSGSVSPDELATQRFRNLLTSAAEKYDVVLIDGPPILQNVDAENLALAVDGVVIVAEAMGSIRFVTSRAVRTIQETNCVLLGVLLNQTVPPFAQRSGD